MSVTISQTQIAFNAYRLTFSSTELDPVYRIYRDGIIIETTKRNWKDIEVYPGAAVQIEVRDDANAPAEAWPGQVLLSWGRDDTAASYRVEVYANAAWATERLVIDGSLYHWTPYLADNTIHRYRIVPVDANGIDGQAREFSIAMVRRPDVPSVTLTYNGDNTATVDAA